jgi:fatty acid desaturase
MITSHADTISRRQPPAASRHEAAATLPDARFSFSWSLVLIRQTFLFFTDEFQWPPPILRWFSLSAFSEMILRRIAAEIAATLVITVFIYFVIERQ